LASGLNPTERTIVVVIAFIIAVVVSVALPKAGLPALPVVGVAFAIPLVFGTWTLRLRAAMVLSLGICAASVLFLVFSGAPSVGPIVALCAGDLAVGAGIGWLNGRKQSREAKWRHTKALKERHDKETFEPAINLFHFIDREGTALRRNEASRAAVGFPTKRSLQLSEYVHPEDMDRMKAELFRLFEREEIRGVKIRFISEERKAFPVELRATRIGERLAILEARDRSREDELERRVMETEARYRILIEKAIDTLDSGIVLTDQRQEVVWANATVGRFFGIDRDRLIGVDDKRARSRYVGAFEEAQSFSDAVEKAVEKGEKVESMTCHVRPTLGREERVLEYRSLPIDAERGRKGRIDHFIDVTELKRLEASLREKTDNLEKSNEKLEEFSHVV